MGSPLLHVYDNSEDDVKMLRLHVMVRVLVADQLQIGYIVSGWSDQLKNSVGSICNLKGKSLADHKIVES